MADWMLFSRPRNGVAERGRDASSVRRMYSAAPCRRPAMSHAVSGSTSCARAQPVPPASQPLDHVRATCDDLSSQGQVLGKDDFLGVRLEKGRRGVTSFGNSSVVVNRFTRVMYLTLRKNFCTKKAARLILY